MNQPQVIASENIKVNCYNQALQKRETTELEISYYEDDVVRFEIPENIIMDIELVKNRMIAVRKMSRVSRPFFIGIYTGKPHDVTPEFVRYIGSEEHLSQYSGMAVVNPFQNSVVSNAINYFNAFSDLFSNKAQTRFFKHIKDAERWAGSTGWP